MSRADEIAQELSESCEKKSDIITTLYTSDFM